MTISSEAKKVYRETSKLYRFCVNPDNILCSTKYIFIFSHMRSRSSVLSHILGSNPEICGHSELHLNYNGRMSLMKMRIELFNDLKCNFKDKYLLDKILNNFQFSDKVFKIAKPKVIFLLRDPESTIKSIINMGHITGVAWYKDPIQATQYYCSRLFELEEYSKKIAGRYSFIDSNDLVDNTEDVLENLTSWLKLDESLDKNYSVFNNTGKTGHGDPSDNIKSGILKKTKSYPDIKLPQDMIQKGESSYEKCRKTLLTGFVKQDHFSPAPDFSLK